MGKHSYPKRVLRLPVVNTGKARTAAILSGAMLSPFAIAAAGISVGYSIEHSGNEQMAAQLTSMRQQTPQDPANGTAGVPQAGQARQAQEAAWAEYDGSPQYFEDRRRTFGEMTEDEIATALAEGDGGDLSTRGEKNGGLPLKTHDAQGGSDTQIPGSPNSQTPNLWDGVAQCESGGNWQINTGNGYYGGLQFSKSTWDLYGGEEFADYPHQATKEEQIIVAERVLAGFEGVAPQGQGAWPTCGQYLAENPAPTPSDGITGPDCPLGPGSNYGFSQNADFVYRALCHYFPQIKNYGGYRAGDPQDHGSGHAVDAMVYGDGATGDAALDFLLRNRTELGIKYIIWKQTIYGDWDNDGDGISWEAEGMEDRGSITQNHFDHIHISVY